MKKSVFMAMLLFCGSVAADGLKQMNAFIQGLHAFKADFVQKTYSRGKWVEESGIMVLQIPGKFRWDYISPTKHVMVADGMHIWLYDAELQQAQKKEQGSFMDKAPAQILAGRIADIKKHFNLKPMETPDGTQWVVFTPRDTENEYDRIEVGFSLKQLTNMRIKDKIGHETEFVFSGQSRNPRLSENFFSFYPPKETDILNLD